MNKFKNFVKAVLPKSFRNFYIKKRSQYWEKKFQSFENTPFEVPNGADLGVNLIGYIRGEFGLGESCRLVADALEEAGIPFTIYNYDQISDIRQGDASWDSKITNTTPYAINLFHLGPIEMGQAFKKFGRKLWDGRYNIAFWMWELENLPPQWIPMISLVDEIWTASEYSAISMRKATQKPVIVMHYGIKKPKTNLEKYSYSYFSLPEDKFLYLCMYDSNSTMERKNPQGAIEAYLNAFPKEKKEVGLVIKINNAKSEDLKILKKLTAGYENIYFITDILTKTAVNSLISLSDVYLSLHRSEGFGLVLAESMYLKTPVVATNYSSVIEFMDEQTGAMIKYQKVDIEAEDGIYQRGNSWAEPDLTDAKNKVLKLYEDKEYYENIRENAYKSVQKNLSPSKAGVLFKSRIDKIVS